MVQYCFTSTETMRLVRTDSPGRPPRLSHSSWNMTFLFAQLLHSDHATGVNKRGALRPQKPHGLLATGWGGGWGGKGRRGYRKWEPRPTSLFTQQLLSHHATDVNKHGALRPQKPYGLLGTGAELDKEWEPRPAFLFTEFLSSDYVTKQTWCFTSTETTWIIRDGGWMV